MAKNRVKKRSSKITKIEEMPVEDTRMEDIVESVEEVTIGDTLAEDAVVAKQLDIGENTVEQNIVKHEKVLAQYDMVNYRPSVEKLADALKKGNDIVAMEVLDTCDTPEQSWFITYHAAKLVLKTVAKPKKAGPKASTFFTPNLDADKPYELSYYVAKCTYFGLWIPGITAPYSDKNVDEKFLVTEGNWGHKIHSASGLNPYTRDGIRLWTLANKEVKALTKAFTDMALSGEHSRDELQAAKDAIDAKKAEVLPCPYFSFATEEEAREAVMSNYKFSQDRGDLHGIAAVGRHEPIHAAPLAPTDEL